MPGSLSRRTEGIVPSHKTFLSAPQSSLFGNPSPQIPKVHTTSLFCLQALESRRPLDLLLPWVLWSLSQMCYCIYKQLPQPNHVHLAPSAIVPGPDLKSLPNPDPSALRPGSGSQGLASGIALPTTLPNPLLATSQPPHPQGLSASGLVGKMI